MMHIVYQMDNKGNKNMELWIDDTKVCDLNNVTKPYIIIKLVDTANHVRELVKGAFDESSLW